MLSAISIIVGVIAVLYALFIIYVLWTWSRIPDTDMNNHVRDLQVEVIVPVKNEALTIGKTLNSILDNSQIPNIVTVIDDGSKDETQSIASQHLRPTDNLLITGSAARGKKNAITLAVNHSHADFILTTDGDCEVSRHWVQSLVSTLNAGNNDLVLGPVFIQEPKGLLGHFQQFDFIATMALSQFAHFKKWFYSGTATSMAYRRKFFKATDPYHDNLHIPSGDDIFLIEKVAVKGDKITFIKNKNTFVLTQSEGNWKKLWQQRIRWASKSKYYSNSDIKFFWIIISLALIAFCGSLALLLSTHPVILLAGIWLLKALVDLSLIRSVARYYELTTNYWYFIPCLFIYPFFTIAIGFSSFLYSANKW